MLILKQKIFIILYPPFENSTTRIAIFNIVEQLKDRLEQIIGMYVET